MAVCSWCEKEMIGSDSCVKEQIEISGQKYDQIPYGEETGEWSSERCHDCDVKRGGYHHPGCDVEECPNCHGQLISCGCLAGATP